MKKTYSPSPTFLKGKENTNIPFNRKARRVHYKQTGLMFPVILKPAENLRKRRIENGKKEKV